MTAIYYLFVAELMAFGLMWHNKPSRPERDHESGDPDPALMFHHRVNTSSKAPAAKGAPDEKATRKIHPDILQYGSATK